MIQKKANRFRYFTVIKLFKAVVFDFDGTLADTKDDITKAVQEALSDIGCVVDDHFVERRIGLGGRLVIKEALEDNKISYNDSLIEKLVARAVRARLKFLNGVKLFDGAFELLGALHNRIRIALATMSSRDAIDILLRERGLAKYFEVVISADEVLKPKPAPEIFLKCADKLGLDPKDCVVVEDSVFGVQAAKAAGMKCIAVASGAYTAEELRSKGSDLVVTSINDREEILNFLF